MHIQCLLSWQSCEPVLSTHTQLCLKNSPPAALDNIFLLSHLWCISTRDVSLSDSVPASCIVIPPFLRVLLTVCLFIHLFQKVLKGHDDHVITCLQFCGNRIVSGSDDNTLKVWSAITGKVWANYLRSQKLTEDMPINLNHLHSFFWLERPFTYAACCTFSYM